MFHIQEELITLRWLLWIAFPFSTCGLTLQVTPEGIHSLYTRILHVCVCTGNHAIYFLLRQLRCSRGGASNQDNCIDWGADWVGTAGFKYRGGGKLCLNSSCDGWRMPFHFGISVWTIFSNSSVLIITHGHSHPEDLLLTIPSWGLSAWVSSHSPKTCTIYMVSPWLPFRHARMYSLVLLSEPE